MRELLEKVPPLVPNQATSAGDQRGLRTNDPGHHPQRPGNRTQRPFIVWNLGDIGKTPFGVASGQAAALTQATSFFNSTVSAGLDALNIDLIRLNVFALFNEVIANPAAFGLTNVTTPACTVPLSLLCTSATLVAPNAPQTFLFADGVHPTTAGHQILAGYAASVIDAPQKIGLLAEAPLQVEQANFRALDARMLSSLGARGRRTSSMRTRSTTTATTTGAAISAAATVRRIRSSSAAT